MVSGSATPCRLSVSDKGENEGKEGSKLGGEENDPNAGFQNQLQTCVVVVATKFHEKITSV